jgi:HK97 gp10 family phage protein
MIIVKTEGFEELETTLASLAEGFRTDLVLRNTVTKAAKRAMEPVASDVIAAAPYDEKNTGPVHLRDSVRLDARTPNAKDYQSSMINQTDIVIATVSVKKSAVSLSQEFGNAHTPAHPYLRNSLARNVDRVIGIFKSELETLVPAYAAKLAKRRK